MNKIIITFLVFVGFAQIAYSQIQVPTLAKDINSTPMNGDPTNFFVHGDIMFFTARNNSIHGSELWKTDGTDSGTVLVKDINVGSGSSNPRNYCSVGNIAYFTAFNGVNGEELWRSDGTDTGTYLVKDIFTGGTSSLPSKLINYDGKLIFVATSSGIGQELWISDGTEAGTMLVKDIRLGSNSSDINHLVVYKNKVYFSANDGSKGIELWVSDGTNDGTFMLKDIRIGSSNGFANNGMIVFNNKLFFAANDGANGVELWISDGTDSGTVIYEDHVPGSNSSNPSNFTIVGNTLFFSGTSPNKGNELLKTDGINSIQVIDIDPNGSSTPRDLVNVNGTLFFTADVNNGRELYVSNGTLSGTKLTRDLYPIQTDAFIKYMTVVDTVLFFTAHQSPDYQDYELFAATPSNTYPRKVKDIVVGASDNPLNLTAFKGKLFFSVNDQVHGNEMWTATINTAELFKDIYVGTPSSGITSIASYVGGVMFNAVTDVGNELWKSDGTPANTLLVKDINSGSSSSNPRDLFTDGARVYFTANRSSYSDLHYSDGTTSGTGHINFNSVHNSYQEQLRIGETLYLTFRGFSHYNLYYYKSTSYGYRVVTLSLSDFGDKVHNLTNYKGMLYFTADDSNPYGHELWKTDGTISGTKVVRDIGSSSNGSDPGNLLVLDTVLLFSANNGSTGSELWITEGEASNTKLLKDIRAGALGSSISQMTKFRNKAYFTANDGIHGVELWSTDGTASGTQLFLDLISGSNGSFPKQLTVVDTLLYFVVNDSIHGDELWVTNGTPEGTRIVKDINSSIEGSNVKNLKPVRNLLYFSANDGIHGQELWFTDGTEVGTQMIKEVYEGAIGSNPSLLTLSGDTLYYTADHPYYGNELWWIFTNCMVGGFLANNTCVGDTITFNDITNPLGTDINNKIWDFGDGVSGSGSQVKHAYTSAGKYAVTVTVSNTNGCIVNTTKTIEIKEIPIAKFVANKDSICFKNNSVSFYNHSIPATGENTKWLFGDGQTSSNFSPTYSYSTPGTFNVKLIVGDKPTCSDTAESTVVIVPTPNPPTIIGKIIANINEIDSFYVVPNVGSIYIWSVTNGTILSGQGTNKVKVEWKSDFTSATVRVNERNAFGCTGENRIHNVSLGIASIDNHSVNIGFKIYPNPANDFFTIENSKNTTNCTYEIRNQLGQLILSGKLHDDNNIIDTKHFSKGIYIVKIGDETNYYVQKIVIQ